MDRPNILYIHSHDTGRYVQPYGHAVPTPHIQRLAEQGVVFRQNFSMAPTCSASRAALLTGMAPHSAGMIGLAHRGFPLHDYRQHLIHTLHDAGYTSALAGVQHVAARPEQIGYHRVLLSKNGRAKVPSTAEHVAPAAAAYLGDAPQQPFFLSVGFVETHREFPEPAADDAWYVRPPDPVPDTAATRRDMAAYIASARILDDGIGRVLSALDESGLADNTVVICTTDHGVAFPGAKCNLTQHGLGTMLIVRGPKHLVGQGVLDALVSHVDIFPTLCEMLQIDPPAWLQGHSLVPLLRGERNEVNKAVFGEVTYHAAYEPQRAVRTQRWNYIRRYGDRDLPVLPNCDDSPSKNVWLEAGWGQRPVPREQLYDLTLDPQERDNVADSPAMRPVLEEMRAQLDAWMAATEDPLLSGEPVPAPSGAQINDPDGLSPKETPLTVS